MSSLKMPQATSSPTLAIAVLPRQNYARTDLNDLSGTPNMVTSFTMLR
jgi:hypothetical protein